MMLITLISNNIVGIVVSKTASYSKNYGVQMPLRHTVPIMWAITKAVFAGKD